MDIAFFNTGKTPEPASKNSGASVILAMTLSFILLIIAAYFMCIRLGLIAPPVTDCCLRTLELNFNFDLEESGARCTDDTVSCQ